MTREEAIKILRYNSNVIHQTMNGETDPKEVEALDMAIKALEQESKTDKYEYHTDHTDCIWYGNDSGCPATCSQYRDGWNDAMDYIFKNGEGYQPYRRDG